MVEIIILIKLYNTFVLSEYIYNYIIIIVCIYYMSYYFIVPLV